MSKEQNDIGVQIRIRNKTHRQIGVLRKLDKRSYNIDEIDFIVEKYFDEHPDVIPEMKESIKQEVNA